MLSDLKLWQRNLVLIMFLISILFLIIGAIIFGLVTINLALPFWVASVILFVSTTVIWMVFNKINR